MKIQLTRPWIEEEEYHAVKEVLDSGYLTDGPVTRAFEKEFADYLGVDFAVGTTSCATALDLALRIANIKPGDEVIVPDFTHPATADMVKLVGANPVLVDVDEKTYNVTADQIEDAITDKTRCLMPVSLFGQPLDINPIMKLAHTHNLSVIEDAACSAGAEFNGVKTGSIPHISCFSFHPRKVITTGEGGMLVTNNEEWATFARSMKHFGASGLVPGTKIVNFPNIGTNYKLTNIQSAIGRAQLKRINKIITVRQEKIKLYNDLIGNFDFIKPPFVPKNAKHTFQCYCSMLNSDIDRNGVIRMMSEKEIETQIGSYCLHAQPVFANDKRAGELTTAKKLYDQGLVLPLHKDLTEDDQHFVVKTLKECANKCKRNS